MSDDQHRGRRRPPGNQYGRNDYRSGEQSRDRNRHYRDDQQRNTHHSKERHHYQHHHHQQQQQQQHYHQPQKQESYREYRQRKESGSGRFDDDNRGRRHFSGGGDRVIDEARASTSRRAREPNSSEPEPKAKFVKTENVEASASGSSSGAVVKAENPVSVKQEPRQPRSRFDMVQTRPADAVTKTGTEGDQMTLVTNYFRISKTPDWMIYQYHVDFEPAIEVRHIRNGLLGEHRSLLGGFLYDGMKLFTTKKLREDTTILKCISKKSQDEYSITLKFVGVTACDDMQFLQILNIILRKSMEGLKLQLVGRNLYDPQALVNLHQYRLQLWPGYQTSIRQHENDILLCAEITHKVMRTETLYDILVTTTQNSRNYQDEYRRNVIGLIVLTDYNNQTYRINDVNFEGNPMDTFDMKGQKVSFVDYYQMKYKIKIRDPRQPLLLTTSKNKRNGEKEEEKLVVLIPELCRATGLTDNMRQDFRLMSTMANHTQLNPNVRMERLMKFNHRLQQTAESTKVLKDWNLKLESSLVTLTGRNLRSERIIFKNGREIDAGNGADWTQAFRNVQLYSTHDQGLNRWAVVCPERNCREFRNFVNSLIRAGSGLNMSIREPREVIIRNDRNSCYVDAIEQCARQDPQLVMILVPNNNAERYSTVKKKGCLERAIPTQVITQKCVSNPKRLMSIATKVAIQMNCKMGYTPWMISLRVQGLMTMGYDVAKSTKDRSKKFGALVATMDLTKSGSFYSTVSEGSAYDVCANNLWPMVANALNEYRDQHNCLPNRILFYRDGISEGSLKQVYEYEVKEVVKNLEEEYRRHGATETPKFAYVIVSKSINTRFFKGNSNPPPGTIVDDVVTLPERYDFYLVSQSVRQGTVSPTSYNIVYSTLKVKPDMMQILTYKMTHLYYNWSGTTRVPAVCQYAKKLATLVATSLHKPPQLMEKKLFYL